MTPRPTHQRFELEHFELALAAEHFQGNSECLPFARAPGGPT
jgi:hypothetical protein